MEQRIQFGKLVESAQIGKMTIKNRMIMAPMGTALSDERGLVTREMEDYYEARARGGVGMVIVENAGVDFPQGRQRVRSLSIYGERTLEGLSRLANVIQKHGAMAAIQLHHAGRVAKSQATGLQPVAPSAVPAPGGEVPRELTREEIKGLVLRFAEAAKLAQRAGFDGIEIHAAHHYLIAQFLSGASNLRRDEYGGSVQNRTRFLLEVIAAVKKSVGEDFPVWCRLNARELGMEKGLSLGEALEIAKHVERSGVEAMSVSAFGYGRFDGTIKPEKEGALLPFAEAFKKTVSKPIMAAGMITPALGEQALRNGQADLVVLGRALIADPELPQKVVRGEEEDIRPCILCYYCDDSRSSGGSIRCSVNPATGREGEYVIRPAKERKDVIIIGGGPAGMEAGRVAALRGHRVRIYEKDEKLGGQLRLASVPPHKERIGRLADYFISQLKKLGIEIALEREVTAEWLKEAKPDTVIVTTGSTELLPHFSGVVEVPIHSARDVLSGKAETGERVTILGGGMVGCEVAEFLKGQGKKVSVVEVLPELASNMRPTPRKKMLERLAQESIVFLIQARLERIDGRGLLCIDKVGNGVRIQTDTLVYATGVTADQRLFDSLKGVFLHLVQAGDCIQPRSLIEAIDEGMQAGLKA